MATDTTITCCGHCRAPLAGTRDTFGYYPGQSLCAACWYASYECLNCTKRIQAGELCAACHDASFIAWDFGAERRAVKRARRGGSFFAPGRAAK